MKKTISSLTVLAAMLAAPAIAETPRVNMWKEIYKTIDLGPHKTPNEKVHIECHFDLITAQYTRYGAGTELKLNKAPNRKRCEFAIQDVFERDASGAIKEFTLSWQFSTNDNFAHFQQWMSYFQIHSVPDSGESWRCPIMALESVSGALRMYNRWDESPISTTKNGTCGNAGNSIKYRKLFEHPYESKIWNNVEISGRLHYEGEPCLTVKLNDNVVSNVCGPNTFNDKKVPYIKFGVYKPTTWESDEEIELYIRNIKFRT
ncbi:hypothetical protein TUMSATVNIG1_60310 (plasmid) [Vibrio nigripulchritudo]|uniref:heparin lyase I family protein n=1 Tax=Vibrio nigripulchritudo TaxID=28173 RepID=UPI00190A0C07|nr:heparin lyase I family protein [Vibrio nigripulchritudo]BCL74045.1 hypothetical protein VNTUMSATTG_59820 [Vibrio nigripulchritudo]BDU35422.1 hypothetical protein TUMSATVNIG1_60310 [Vibrio nigripulchritudo]